MHLLTELVASASPVDGGSVSYASLLVGLPLASAAVLLLLGRRADRWGHWVGVLASGAAFVLGLVAFVTVLGRPADQRVLDVKLGTWIDAGSFHLNAGLRVDPL